MGNEFQPRDAIIINDGVKTSFEPPEDILKWRDDGQPEVLFAAGSANSIKSPPLEFRAISTLRLASRSVYIGFLFLQSLIFALLGFPFAIAYAVVTGGFFPRETLNLVLVIWHYCVARLGDRGRNLIDFRRPILLLRAHDDDDVLVDDRFDTNPIGLQTPGELERDRFLSWDRPFEEVVAKAMSRFGPLVALRRKKQKERRFQFRKYLVNYKDWQRQILYWIDRSQLIVVLIGTEKSLRDPRWGLAWEISTLIKTNSFRKVILVMPPVSEWSAMQRWADYESLVRKLVPNADFGDDAPRPDTNVRSDLRRVRVAVVDQNWQHKWVKCQNDGASYQSAITRCICDLAPTRSTLIRLAQGVLQAVVILGGAGVVLLLIAMAGLLAWYLGLDEWLQVLQAEVQ